MRRGKSPPSLMPMPRPCGSGSRLIVDATNASGAAGRKCGKTCVRRAMQVATQSSTLSDALAIELAQGWPMQLREEPQANVDRYDRLRGNDADTAGAGVSP